jgi:hypothetical protein
MKVNVMNKNLPLQMGNGILPLKASVAVSPLMKSQAHYSPGPGAGSDFGVVDISAVDVGSAVDGVEADSWVVDKLCAMGDGNCCW